MSGGGDRIDAGWDGSAAGARTLQPVLATALRLRDGFATPLRQVGGLAFATAADGTTTVALALADADTGAIAHASATRLDAAGDPAAPPGFRALPAVLAAFAGLPCAPPDLLLVAGHGIDHPRGLGSASQFGLSLDIPTIGIARRILHGRGPLPHDTRGAYTALRAPDGRQIGWLLRADAARAPVVVAPGHRVAMASAADLVMRFTPGGRLPSVLRHARRALNASPRIG